MSWIFHKAVLISANFNVFHVCLYRMNSLLKTHTIGSIKLTRWQLALIVGTPLAIGLGIYVYKKTSNPKNKTTKEEDSAAVRSKKALTDKDANKSLSIDGTAEDKELEKRKKTVELESEKLSPLKEATMYKNEGNSCFRNGKYDEAISFYDKAIDKCPPENSADLAICYQNRAAASYEMLKKWAKRVKQDCMLSLQKKPRYA